jgi:hypothetical protein
MGPIGGGGSGGGPSFSGPPLQNLSTACALIYFFVLFIFLFFLHGRGKRFTLS